MTQQFLNDHSADQANYQDELENNPTYQELLRDKQLLENRFKAMQEVEAEENKVVEHKSRFIGLTELMKSPAIPWTVEERIHAKGLGQVFGAPGAGKTLWAVDLALSLASGYTHFQGRPLNTKGKRQHVVYVAQEGSPVFSSFVRGWLEGHPLEDWAEIEPYFHVLDGGRGDQVMMTPDNEKKPVAHEDSYGLFRLDVEDLKSQGKNPVMVFFDTQIDLFAMVNENDAQETIKVMKQLQSDAYTDNAFYMLVHHEGKNGDYRGSSAQLGKLDVHVQLEVEPNGSRSTRYNKVKGAEKPEQKDFYVIAVNEIEVQDEDGNPKTVTVPYARSTADMPVGERLVTMSTATLPRPKVQAIQAFVGMEPKTKQQIADFLQIGRGTKEMTETLDALKKGSYLRETDPGNQKTKWIVDEWISDEG